MAAAPSALRVPPATPAINAALETSPSIAPKTAGRSQPPVTSACSCPTTCAAGRSPMEVKLARDGDFVTEGEAHLSGRSSLPLVLRSGSFRSEEHPSDLQSLMRISYAAFCLKKKKQKNI